MPGDFREYFDVRKLSDQQKGEIAFILNSPAYEHSFKPYIMGIINQLNHLWKDRSQSRKDAYPDDFLGGGVVFGEGMLKFFETLVQETSIEAIHEAMQNVDNDTLYDRALQRGEVRPVVGLDQPVLPQLVDPEEY